jgi:hypothetical protein
MSFRKEINMKIRDTRLMKWTKSVWTELVDADCNPDIIPLSLCDACEMGFNKGFTAGITVTAITLTAALVGGTAWGLWEQHKK